MKAHDKISKQQKWKTKTEKLYLFLWEMNLVTKYRNKNKSDDLKPKKLFLFSWQIKANDKISKPEKP